MPNCCCSLANVAAPAQNGAKHVATNSADNAALAPAARVSRGERVAGQAAGLRPRGVLTVEALVRAPQPAQRGALHVHHNPSAANPASVTSLCAPAMPANSNIGPGVEQADPVPAVPG
jgi:hypothetical protein